MSAPDEDFQAPQPPPMPEAESRAPRPTKLRPFAIAFFVIGLAVLGAGIPKLIPGGVSTGGLLALFGLVLFAFSFIPLPVIPDAEPPLPFFAKAMGIFYKPTRVFRNLRAHPHWVGAFAVVSVLTVIYAFAFVQRITPARIVDHITQGLLKLGPPFAPKPDQLEKMKTEQLEQLKSPIERVGGGVRAVIVVFLSVAFTAALCLLGILAFGGRINYWQALAVVFYVWLPVVAIQKILGLVILYLKAPEDLHPILNQDTTLQDNLGIFFRPANHPVLFVVLSFIGLTWFYLVWLRAKGLRYGGTNVGSGAAWGVSIMVYALLALLATVWTSLIPVFIS